MSFDHRDYVRPFGKAVRVKQFFGYNDEAEMLTHMPKEFHQEIKDKAVLVNGYMRAELENFIVAY